MADRTGQQFGNYRLIPLAGRGRFILVSIFVSTHWLLSKQFARDEKLIRRDIKPENMLLGRRYEILLVTLASPL